MRNGYRYSLEPGSRKHQCPACKKRRFVRYVDVETGKYLPIEYGRCDRVLNCTYHLNPYKDGYAKMNWSRENRIDKGQIHLCSHPARESPQFTEYSSISFEILRDSRKDFGQNNLVSWLGTLFPAPIVEELIKMYHIGTSTLWPGSTIFWQIDQSGVIRTGKIMLYNRINGKRVKEPFPHVSFIHKTLNFEDFKLKQCFFGEHLLAIHRNKLACIVESEKTALIASAYMPHYIWLAVGSLNNLNIEKCMVLKGRDILLFPDASKDGNAHQLWNEKAAEINKKIPEAHFFVTDLLEKQATENDRARGFDLADYLIYYSLPPSKMSEQPGHPIVESEFLPKIKSEKSEKSEALEKRLLFPIQPYRNPDYNVPQS
jgi:hypothetical protein